MRKQSKGVRVTALLLTLVLFLTAAVSCQFPFDLSEKETERQSGDVGSADSASESQTVMLESGEPISSATGEKTDEDLDFVQDTETEGAFETSRHETAVPETESTSGIAYDVSSIVSAVMPAMVAITVKVTNVQTGILGGSYEYESEGAGSGIIVAQDESFLYIVTNNHVVEDSNSISVCFVDGTEYKGIIKGSDASHDLAVLLVKIDEMSEKTLADIRVAKIGNSNELRLGQGAIAIGNALGYGQSVTIGCISALGRSVKNDDGLSVSLIQTDAAINPGNSGGALLNMQGEVVGINSMKYASTEVEGMGYAIPISDALPIMQSLIEEKFYDENERGYLGISCTAYTQGLYVSLVAENSPAAKAGLKKGDIITEANGKTVKTVSELTEILSHMTAGDSLKIGFLRKSGTAYEKMETTAVLVMRSEAS